MTLLFGGVARRVVIFPLPAFLYLNPIIILFREARLCGYR
nr:MAG TPA: hypothetical protein [Caudoviricetes sp.]